MKVEVEKKVVKIEECELKVLVRWGLRDDWNEVYMDDKSGGS